MRGTLRKETISVSVPEAWIRLKFRDIAWLVERLGKYAIKSIKARIRAFIDSRIEYYLDFETGTVKVRRSTGRAGSYKWMHGKMVKVSSIADVKVDLIPWSEVNAGYYDEELGTRIFSKDQYRQEMKKAGLVPYEKNLYGKSRKQILSEQIESTMKKSEPKVREAFARACEANGIYD